MKASVRVELACQRAVWSTHRVSLVNLPACTVESTSVQALRTLSWALLLRFYPFPLPPTLFPLPSPLFPFSSSLFPLPFFLSPLFPLPPFSPSPFFPFPFSSTPFSPSPFFLFPLFPLPFFLFLSPAPFLCLLTPARSSPERRRGGLRGPAVGPPPPFRRRSRGRHAHSIPHPCVGVKSSQVYT